MLRFVPWSRARWRGFASVASLSAITLSLGCSLSPGLGVPHEDPEPIGSAPWEREGNLDSKDPEGKLDSDAQGRAQARNRARKNKHGSASSSSTPAASASAAPPAPLDSDGDGVEDARDKCPLEKGADDPNPAWAGCPYDAPPRPTPPRQDDDIDMAFGDSPASLDAQQTAAVKGLGSDMKDQSAVTLSTYARTKAQGDSWLKLLKATLVQGGVDPTHIVTQVCLQKSGLTHTVLTRGKKDCDAL